jgi:(E)-4-hydroxy-3-methylbut-2-enyl-diphosphate synthase
MTNTDTVDVEGTALQIEQLARAWFRARPNHSEHASGCRGCSAHRRRLEERGVSVPIIGDFHYNGHILLKEYPACARALAKYRINPGNVGPGQHHDKNFQSMIEVAVEKQQARPYWSQLGLARSRSADTFNE